MTPRYQKLLSIILKVVLKNEINVVLQLYSSRSVQSLQDVAQSSYTKSINFLIEFHLILQRTQHSSNPHLYLVLNNQRLPSLLVSETDEFVVPTERPIKLHFHINVNPNLIAVLDIIFQPSYCSKQIEVNLHSILQVPLDGIPKRDA